MILKKQFLRKNLFTANKGNDSNLLIVFYVQI
ncbi:fimbriae usher protein StfC, partial [Escherichia coli]|nr:fimbriae usher protein StfC [Escherichia coli]